VRQVFVDTAALVALGNQQDDWHKQAVVVSRQLTLAGCHFVTTDAVLLESATPLAAPRSSPWRFG
jgi:predicted nucleic acid-binding protein